MGGTALLLVLSLAAAQEPGFDALVAEGRRAHAELRPALEELAALRDSYAWERDGRAAARRREALRARVAAASSAAQGADDALEKALRRYSSEHGLEAIERYATGKAQSSAEVMGAMAAHTYLTGARTELRQARLELDAEAAEWGRFALIDAERRSYRRLLWGLGTALAALLAFVAYAVAASRRRRRRRGAPITIIPG